MDKIVVAKVEGDSIAGCDIHGKLHTLPRSAPIDEWFVSGHGYNSLYMRNIKYCGGYDVAIVEEAVFCLQRCAEVLIS